MRLAVRVVVDQRDAAGGVPHQVHHRELDVAEAQRVAVLEEHLGLDRDLGGVERVGEGASPGRSDHLGESLPVVAVPVGRHHSD